MLATGFAPFRSRGARGTRSHLGFWCASLVALVQTALAGAIDFEGALGAVPESICNGAVFLQGPVGFAIVALVFIIGGLRILAGNRGGIGLIITSVVMGLVFIAAPEILAVFTQDGCL